MEIILIFVWLLMGLWCYSIAKRQGRNTLLGFVMGGLFGLFAVIVYACIGESKELKAQKIKDAVNEALKNKSEAWGFFTIINF